MQETAFRQLDKEDGLSSNTVFDITQDKDGFMWFATRDGLNRYDGYAFKVFRYTGDTTNTIIDNDVRVLHYDTTLQSLWIGTERGLCRYEPRRDTFHHYRVLSSGPGLPIIRFMEFDAAGTFWVCTQAAIFRYVASEDRFVNMYTFTNEEINIRSWLEAIDAPGQFWLGTDKGLYHVSLKPEGMEVVPAADRFPSLTAVSGHRIRSLCYRDATSLWLGTFDQGAYRWDFKEDRIESLMVLNGNIQFIAADDASNLWVGTTSGLFRQNQGFQDFEPVLSQRDQEGSLAGNPVKSIFFDAKGSIWAGTYFEGVKYLDRDWGNFKHHTPGPSTRSLSFKVVSAFAEQEDGRIWIGTEGGGLNLFDPDHGAFTWYKRGTDPYATLSSNNIKSLLLEHDRELWIGTYQAGLDKLNLQTGQITNYRMPSSGPGLPHNSVYTMVRNGADLWLGTFGGGLCRFDTQVGRFRTYDHNPADSTSLSNNLVRKVLFDQESILWVGTENGLNKMVTDEEGQERFIKYLPELRVLSIHDAKDALWLGSRSMGLLHFVKATGEVTRFSKADGLAGETVFGILEDSCGHLWLSTDEGICQFDPGQSRFTSYNDGAGLERREFNVNAYLSTGSGNLYFGSKTGFTFFNPDEVQLSDYIPPVIIHDFRTHSNGIDTTAVKDAFLQHQVIVLPYNQASFSVDFASLDYSDPENNHYTFMLEGLDRQWHYNTGVPFATYTIQREGRYTFQLKGGNNHGLWNPEIQTLEIQVLPPFYRSGWAMFFFMVLIGGVLYAIYRYTQLKSRLRIEQILREQEEKLHESRLEFYTDVAHDLRTPLSLIVNPLDRMIQHDLIEERVRTPLQAVRRNAGRLLQMLDQIITFRQVESRHLKLAVREEDFGTFIAEICDSFRATADSRRIDFRLEQPPGSWRLWFDAEKLGRVYYNLLSNAFKFTPDMGKIHVALRKEDDHVKVSISDSGCGIAPEIREQIFDKFYHRHQENTPGSTAYGIGLALSRQMIDLHQGIIQVKESAWGGACFETGIRMGRQHYRPEDFVEEGSHQSNTGSKEWSAPSPTRTERLLIVDDDGEVLEFLQEHFSRLYQVVSTSSGHKALQLAKEEKPDLILCDVMMPGLDGIGLCQILKEQIETSHIPLILVTARNTHQDKMMGLHSGADDYLTKPFDIPELELRIRNLLDNREKLRRRYARTETYEPKNVKIADADEIFMEKVMQIVEKHLSDVQFSVEDFARELAVSRPLLFTKIKSLTGMTPNNFVKTVRLKRAKQLLEQDKLSISEISFRVGFRDARYFRRCFKQLYKQTPSEVLKR